MRGGRHIAAVAIIAGLAGQALAAEPVPARQAALTHLLKHDCGSCHGLTLKGGLGPPLVAEALAKKDTQLLIDTILFGRHRTPMPPWQGLITPNEAEWLVNRMRQGGVGG